MRRIAVCVILSVVIGVLLTVGVAWALAAFVAPEGSPYTAVSANQTPCWAVVEMSDTPGVTRRLVWLEKRPVPWPLMKEAPNWSRLSEPVPDAGGLRSRIEDARGWPFLAMYCWWETRDRPMSIPDVTEGIDLSPRGVKGVNNYTAPRALPLRIIWPGFLWNWMIYSAFAFLLLYGPGAVRRRLHIPPGACKHCRYDLTAADHEVCPECGASTDKKQTDATKAGDAA